MNTRPAHRDSEQTRQRILAAVGEVLSETGFREVGINAIARRANVDKVLIYRYFGGLPELLKAFAEEGNFWPTNEDLLATVPGGHVEGRPAGPSAALIAFARELRKRPLTQELMRWELLERNELTDALARHRERQGESLFDSLEQSSGADVRAIGSLLSAGLTYLILRSKTADVYNGLQLNSEQDWERIERAAVTLAEAALASGPKKRGRGRSEPSA